LTNLPRNFLLFLGTSGARFSMIYQLRASGGMWIRINGKNIVVDPGPGSLVKICERLPELDPTVIDAIILTHCHMDHSNDLNVLIEAMTFGGRVRRGVVVASEDSVSGGRKVLLDHVRGHMQGLETWKDNKTIELDGDIKVTGHKLYHHGVECFGFTIENENIPRIGIISDTKLLDTWINSFANCKVLVANTTLLKKIERIDHLSIEEVPILLDRLFPKAMILNHMGTSVLEAGPAKLAESLCNQRSRVIAARDGMIFDMDKLEITESSKEDDTYRAGRLKDLIFSRRQK